MNLELALAAGIASGTVLLFAAIGELFTERSGIINLGVQGMMFLGALVGFKVGVEVDPWLGLVLAMVAGALLAGLHGIMTIHLQANQIVSGLALTFLGTGWPWCSARDCPPAAPRSCRSSRCPLLSQIPFLGGVFFTEHSILVYIGYLLVPVAVDLDLPHPAWPASACRGRAAQCRRCTRGQRLPPALRVHHARRRAGRPRRRDHHHVPGAGLACRCHGHDPGLDRRRARHLRPVEALRTTFGAYMVAFIFRLTHRPAGAQGLPVGIPNIFYEYQPSTFFLGMLPYAMVIFVLIIAAREANRKRIGAPAALGRPTSGANAATSSGGRPGNRGALSASLGVAAQWQSLRSAVGEPGGCRPVAVADSQPPRLA